MVTSCTAPWNRLKVTSVAYLNFIVPQSMFAFWKGLSTVNVVDNHITFPANMFFMVDKTLGNQLLVTLVLKAYSLCHRKSNMLSQTAKIFTPLTIPMESWSLAPLALESRSSHLLLPLDPLLSGKGW